MAYRSKHTKNHLFWVGFHEVIILVYMNLDLGNLVADRLMIWSEFIWTIFRMQNEGMNLPKWTRTKSSTNQRPDYRGPSSYRPRLLLHENGREINAFLSIWTRAIFEFIYALSCIQETAILVHFRPIQNAPKFQFDMWSTNFKSSSETESNWNFSALRLALRCTKFSRQISF